MPLYHSDSFVSINGIEIETIDEENSPQILWIRMKKRMLKALALEKHEDICEH